MPNLQANFEHSLIFFNSFLKFFFDLTKFEKWPVCISIQSALIVLAILMSLIDGLINKLVLIFFFEINL